MVENLKKKLVGNFRKIAGRRGGIRTSDLRFIKCGPNRLSYLLGTIINLFILCVMQILLLFFFHNSILIISYIIIIIIITNILSFELIR
jgi:hypothetical protein